MVKFLKLTIASSGDNLLISVDKIVCIVEQLSAGNPDDLRNTAIYTTENSDNVYIVRETFQQICNEIG